MPAQGWLQPGLGIQVFCSWFLDLFSLETEAGVVLILRSHLASQPPSLLSEQSGLLERDNVAPSLYPQTVGPPSWGMESLRPKGLSGGLACKFTFWQVPGWSLWFAFGLEMTQTE